MRVRQQIEWHMGTLRLRTFMLYRFNHICHFQRILYLLKVVVIGKGPHFFFASFGVYSFFAFLICKMRSKIVRGQWFECLMRAIVVVYALCDETRGSPHTHHTQTLVLIGIYCFIFHDFSVLFISNKVCRS